jgi:hypothetical protein
LLCVASACTAFSQDIVPFETVGQHAVLTPHAGWLAETDTALSADQALELYRAGKFNRATEEWLEVGFMDGTLWLAVTISNLTDEEDLLLEFRNPRISYIDLYILNDQGGFDVQLSGSARPYQERPVLHPMPVFPIELAQGETRTLLMRAQNLGDMRTRLWLWDAGTFYGRMGSAYHAEMITIGSLLVLALFHFLVFLSLKDWAYLYLSAFILFWLLFLMAGNGTGHMLLWNDMPWLALRSNTVFLVIMLIAFVMFTMSFLESRKFTPGLYRAGLAFVGLCFLHLLYTCLTDTLVRIIINRYLVLGTLILVAVLLFTGMRRGSHMAFFFLASWIFLLTGSTLLVLLSWNVGSAQLIFGTPIIHLLFTTSILLWSFELTGRVKGRVLEQRRILEVQVKERTQALEKALSEVKTLSGLLPICSSCKKIRDDTGYWNTVEHYVSRHTDANFTHGICPDCMDHLYPELMKRRPEVPPA